MRDFPEDVEVEMMTPLAGLMPEEGEGRRWLMAAAWWE